MSVKRLISKNTLIAIMAILMLSLIFNTAMIIEIKKYKYKVGTEGYNYIEDVRAIHEGNVQLLSKAIDAGSIDNMGVLKLYKNYSNLTEDIASLWNEYIYYEENRQFVILRKKIDISKITAIDVNNKIEDFFSELLEMEMQNPNYKIELTGKMLDNFNEIYEMESKKTEFYAKFCNDVLNGAVQDLKKDKIIKEHYWIDILEGYNEINKEFIDYEFSINA